MDRPEAVRRQTKLVWIPFGVQGKVKLEGLRCCPESRTCCAGPFREVRRRSRVGKSQESQGLAIPGEFDGTPDVADVFLGVLDSELVIDRGDKILNFYRIILHEHAVFVRRTPNSPTLNTASRYCQGKTIGPM